MRVIIIGAGIVGASTAFHLTEAGVDDVIIVDRMTPGRATAAGAGIVCPWTTSSTDPELIDLSCAGAAEIARVVRRLGELGQFDTGYGRYGAIALTETVDQLVELERTVRTRSSGEHDAGRIEPLDGAACREHFPLLGDRHPGLWIERAARVDGSAFARSLLDAARITPRRGHAEPAVTGGHVTGVSIDGTIVNADIVVVTAGAWTADVLTDLNDRIDVEPQRGQLVHLDVVGPDGRPAPTGTWPLVEAPGPHYLVPFPDGRVVCGATRETGSGFDTNSTAGGQRDVLASAIHWAPALANASLVETRVGLRPLARTGRPTIGRSAHHDNLFIGTGLGAVGLTTGPLAGRLLAEQMIGS